MISNGGEGVRREGIGSMRVLHLELTLEYRAPFRAALGMLSLYRGALGAGLRRASCFTRRSDCTGCEARGRCVYSYVFETPVPRDPHPLLAKYPFAPHPFILKPRLVDEETDRHIIGLTLLGRSISYLTYFVHAFTELGREGIGAEKRRFRIASIIEHSPAGSPRELYDPATDRMDDPQGFRLVLPRLDDPDGEPGELTVEFLTPYRFRDGGKVSDAVHARSLASHAARRMTELFETHGERNERGYGIDPVRGFLERVSSLSTAESNLSWAEVRRHSARQGRDMILGGVTGRITFTGQVAPLVPLLSAAEHLSIGKSTSFGFGQVRLLAGRAKE